MQFHSYADDSHSRQNNGMPVDVAYWSLTNTKLNFYLYSKHIAHGSLYLHFALDLILFSLICKKYIGIIFDKTMAIVPQVNSVCKPAFIRLRNISRLRKCISLKTTESLVHESLSSRLYLLYSPLYSVPKWAIRKLESGSIEKSLRAIARGRVVRLFLGTRL